MVRQFEARRRVQVDEVRIKASEDSASFLQGGGFDRMYAPLDLCSTASMDNRSLDKPHDVKFIELIGETPSCVRTCESFMLDADVASCTYDDDN